MRTIADENYLKEIYTLELDHEHVTTSMLAERFNCAPATVTGMLKKLASLHWVVYEPYQGANLTAVGREIALEVVRHHRLIETYLAQALGIPWDRVHAEADKLEHALSEYLEQRIDELLGHPAFDPHGSPIPTPTGSVPDAGRLRLAELSEGALAEVLEVNDHDPQLLDLLDKRGLRPHARLQVLEVEPVDGLVTLLVSGEKHTLGKLTASQVIVRILDNESL
jgi:DtxR family transcriptional regulator, Mn-dependent transcriptional regulator